MAPKDHSEFGANAEVPEFAGPFNKLYYEASNDWCTRYPRKPRTLNDLAEKTGVDRGTIINWRSSTTPRTLKLLEDGLRALKLVKEEKKPLRQAYFTQNGLGDYETQEELVEALPTIEDKGKLLRRVRLAALKDIGTLLAGQEEITPTQWINQEQGHCKTTKDLDSMIHMAAASFPRYRSDHCIKRMEALCEQEALSANQGNDPSSSVKTHVVSQRTRKVKSAAM